MCDGCLDDDETLAVHGELPVRIARARVWVVFEREHGAAFEEVCGEGLACGVQAPYDGVLVPLLPNGGVDDEALGRGERRGACAALG